jgi:hypothetical protein
VIVQDGISKPIVNVRERLAIEIVVVGREFRARLKRREDEGTVPTPDTCEYRSDTGGLSTLQARRHVRGGGAADEI